jgi:hypothetical protein
MATTNAVAFSASVSSSSSDDDGDNAKHKETIRANQSSFLILKMMINIAVASCLSF